MAKKAPLDIQIAKKKDLEQVLTSILEHHKKLGAKQLYSALQQTVYNLLKKENTLGVIWLVKLDNTCIGHAVLTFGYSLEHGGKDGTISEFFISEPHQKPSVELGVLEQIKTEAKALSITALHLDYNSKNQDLSDIGKKASFSPRDNFRRLTKKL